MINCGIYCRKQALRLFHLLALCYEILHNLTNLKKPKMQASTSLRRMEVDTY